MITIGKEFFLDNAKVNDACAALASGKGIDVLEQRAFHYDAEFQGEHYILEQSNPEGVKKFLDNMFAQLCDDEGVTSSEDEADILKVDAETGDIIERTPYELSYQTENSDFAEHFNQRNFI